MPQRFDHNILVHLLAVQLYHVAVLGHIQLPPLEVDVVHQRLVAVALIDAVHPNRHVHIERLRVLDDLAGNVDGHEQVAGVGGGVGEDGAQVHAGDELGHDVAVLGLQLRCLAHLQFHIPKHLRQRKPVPDLGAVLQALLPELRHLPLIDQAGGELSCGADVLRSDEVHCPGVQMLAVAIHQVQILYLAVLLDHHVCHHICFVQNVHQQRKFHRPLNSSRSYGNPPMAKIIFSSVPIGSMYC